MFDRIALLIIILCLIFGGYKLAASILTPDAAQAPPDTSPAPIAAADAAGNTPQTDAPADTAETPAEPPAAEPQPDTPEPPTAQPPENSLEELNKQYKISGIATGSEGSMVILNQTPLYEGDSLGELTVEKIRPDSIEVSYKGNSYQLPAQIF